MRSNRLGAMNEFIGACFKLQEYQVQPFEQKPAKSLYEKWMNGQGPATLFVYYQKPYKINEQGDIDELRQPAEFFVTYGDGVKLRGKGVYFLRNTKPGSPINPQGTNDEQVLFGEISEHTVGVLKTVINNVYKPMIDQLETAEWRMCETDAQKDFMQTFEKFAKELVEAQESFKSNIVLDPLSENQRTKLRDGRTQDINAILDYAGIFSRWQDKINAYIEDANAERRFDKDDGPVKELDYWKQRMRKLTQVSEQLGSKTCRAVYDLLDTACDQMQDALGVNYQKIYMATSNWRGIDNKITESLSEAKDNVKYLQTLEKYLEPLYVGNPDTIRETLPALMNSIKMIHTIARYYNTTERMTSLFVKITNQMITNCKYNIVNFRNIKLGLPRKGKMGSLSDPKVEVSSTFEDGGLWDETKYPHDELIVVLQSCQALKDAYIKQYDFTKERLESMPKARQFDFSKTDIFGKFELFSRRVRKLIDLFSTIRQFKTLEKHNLENIQPIVDAFNVYVNSFRSKINHPLLDYRDDTFDRDFVEFNVDVSRVETKLTGYIDSNFQNIINIEDSLRLLRKFRTILTRENLQSGLNSKYVVLFNQYSRLISKIEEEYKKKANNPPIVRNLPIVSGSITWSRHLFHRASTPMEQFPRDLLRSKETKKTVKQVAHHNRITYTLFYFEYEWRQRWIVEVEKAKAGLLATLIIRDPGNNGLYVNFDSEIMTLIREAKCLSRIGIEIPESAKIVLLQEEKFKMYKNELTYVLGEYHRIVNKIRPNTKSLLVPHLEDLEYKLRPGMNILTWTSMNIDGYLHHVHAGLSKLEQLIININDIMENRIENNLKALSKTVLVNLPVDSNTYTLDDFVEMQSAWIDTESKKLKSKNYEVEQAVEDLIQTICSYTLDQHVEPISAEEIQKLSKYYSWSMYQALLHATKYSLNQMKERICGRRNMPKLILKPFFEVDVRLDGNNSVLKPSLDEVQSAINRAASHVLKSTKKVQLWFQKDIPEEEKEPFYNWIAKDKEIVKVILLLTGSIQGTKNSVSKFLEGFTTYSWLWMTKPEDDLKKFRQSNPELENYEEKLKDFDHQNEQIEDIQSTHQIGALSLKTLGVKETLSKYILQWKMVFSKDIHKQAKSLMSDLADDIKQIRLKTDKEVKDIDSLGSVMLALEEIRKKQSNINFQFKPIADMYSLIENVLELDRDELDQRKDLQKEWEELVKKAFKVRDSLHEEQAVFKKQLVENIGTLVVEVKVFREDFEKNGPMQVGLTPGEALNKLKDFKEQFSVHNRKYKSYFSGEKLFALPHQSYPALVKTQNELDKLDKLYTLYLKVTETITKWQETPWLDITNEIVGMKDGIELFQKDCLRLPSDCKQYPAYKELKQRLDDMEIVLPLVEMLGDKSIKDRHWQQLIELTGKDIPYASETFLLKDLLQADLLVVQEDVEDISDSALKQMKIEKQLREEIDAYWDVAELDIRPYQNYDFPCTIGGSVNEHKEKLEEHTMNLVQMLATRCITPFRTEVQSKLDTFTSVQETLDKWLKVMSQWMSLVLVFTGGEIAKQMPQTSKVFKNTDAQWRKIMERVAEVKLVIPCCQNELLTSSLPRMQQDLEECQRKLETYLEQKRGVFPRFYFVSNTDLLKILSIGTDPNAIQDDFEKMFDAISRVTFDRVDRRLIKAINQDWGGTTETVELDLTVKCEGNIEDWLCKLEQSMQVSMRTICSQASTECFSMGLDAFITKYQSQVALLGIQMIFTQKVTECLERQRERNALFKQKAQEVSAIMNDLSNMCRDNLPNKLVRTKIETLVTIQVYQKDLFKRIQDDVIASRIRDIGDFDWTKNPRFYWRAEDGKEGNSMISITDVDFYYQYEFLGCKERLCITTLTERCYIALAQALGMSYGGAPAGPAGTGKTETVKDLGRTLGIYVVVTNCSGEHKFRDMAKIFKGVCQSGLWGCFDEFNRISLATLSVVASQVEAITSAKKQRLKQFIFPTDPDKYVTLNMACAYFITMNPGYAGRQELPENLKVLFRGVTMMVPDRRSIIKVKLASVGYHEFDTLDKKFTILYRLCEEQLSKQRHYDFGLRNILSVLRFAGTVLRENYVSGANKSEEYLLASTLTQMNMSKFVMADKSLFTELIGDIFPMVASDIKRSVHAEVEKQLAISLKEQCLQNTPDFMLKLIQLYETSTVRHGFMVVGTAGCGKTSIFNVLTESLSNIEGNAKYIITKMNPKSITGQEMFGVMNSVGEWEPGIFSEIWKAKNAKSNKQNNWICCDGPVDAIWIENLNTVLDDNKILTLANAERIPMLDTTKMTFEVENLRNASPATVSRNGIVYVSDTDLYWEPLFLTWIADRSQRNSLMQPCSPDEEKWILQLITKYFRHKSFDNQNSTDPSQKAVFYFMKKQFSAPMVSPEVVKVTMMINLLTACIKEYTVTGQKVDFELFEKLWCFSFAWALGGLYEKEDRQKFHKEVLEKVGAALPQIKQSANMEKETIFDFCVDQKTRAWMNWKPQEWKPPKKLIFSQLLIPTADSTRAEYIIEKMRTLDDMRSERRKEVGLLNTLLVGSSGTAKTSIVLMNAANLAENYAFKRINFSFYTQPYNFQESIDAEVEKKNAKNFRPLQDKKLVVFLDDFSMPQINDWGDQITLEITRQLIDFGGFYFLDKEERGNPKKITGLQFLAAMAHPTNGRNDVPNRIKRLFFAINIPPPSSKAVEGIYGRILAELLPKKRYTDEIINLIPLLVDATIALWENASNKLLPTPTKFHYVFTIRELARVFGGVARVAQNEKAKVIQTCSNLKDVKDPKLFLLGLWRHECQRTFVDKLINNADKKTFEDILDRVTKDKFRDSFQQEENELITQWQFADFMKEDVVNDDGELLELAPFVYEACPSNEFIKKIAYDKLAIYNERNPSKKMSLVIFDDALAHLLRLTRTINADSGSAMLVGVGGSGKTSLTRLGASICRHFMFQIALTKSYNLNSLFEDIKLLYEKAGPQGGSVAFLMTDAEVKAESFLEAINSMLATGEIPGLFGKDEKEIIPVNCKNIYMKELGVKGEDPPASVLWKYFLNRVKDNLHMVLAFSPVNIKFRQRAQKFPTVFNGCSIDWFLPWPEEALISVSSKFISEFKIDTTDKIKRQLEVHMGKVHKMVDNICAEYFQQMRRYVYVTPKSYLSFIQAYNELYNTKYKAIDKEEQNINRGLFKLQEATQDVEAMKVVLKEENLKLDAATEATNKLLKELDEKNKKADIKTEEVNAVTEACEEQRSTIEAERDIANIELNAALPYLRKAEEAVKSISSKDISEIKTIKKANSTIRIIFDTINILFQKSLDPVVPMVIEIAKGQHAFIADSYDNFGVKNLQGQLLQDLLFFSSHEKNQINEETIELLDPYLNFTSVEEVPKKLFDPEIAKKTSSALWGLCTWAAAMSDYHKQSKIVQPKLKLLEIKTIALTEAQQKLSEAKAQLDEVNAIKAELRARYDNEIDKKQQLADAAAKTRKKMDQANRLINSLQDNKIRWNESRNKFQATKTQLVGDVAKACAFVSYCGPFNATFRAKLTNDYFGQDLISRGIPMTEGLEMTNFLVDQATVGTWNLQGLPNDDLSIQNGIMVTRSTRYPLMIDPQAQAVSWIKRKEPEIEQRGFVYTLSNPNLKDRLKIPLQDGCPVMIENIENEIDPMLDPLLEKQFVQKGRNKIIVIADTEMDYDVGFRLFMTSRLGNPHFSPELAAKTTIIDFTVTQDGLEQQLLGRLISKEQRHLEEQLTQLQEDVTKNTRILAEYDEALLERLAGSTGNLLDDEKLIDVLAEIKIKSKEVGEKLAESKEKTIEIGEKRESFRPVAARGSVLYFCVVEMTLVNWMYNTSLLQFLDLFDYGIDKSTKTQLVKDRVANIINCMTYKVYRYMNRGLFEIDKVTFKLQMCLKILIKSKMLAQADVNMLLKSGSGIDDRNKKFSWMDQKVWLNIVALSKHRFNNEGQGQGFFNALIDKITRLDKEFRKFLDENSPENAIIPEYEDKIVDQPIGHFLHLCFIRSVREDRTVLASQKFIRRVLGDEFMAPVTDQINDVWEESKPTKPILFLLAPGSDPTNTIDELARKKRIQTQKVSMGEEQEIIATKFIADGMRDGFWVILNNCHLSLEFMAEMEDILNPKDKVIHDTFRLWITCEPHKEFPLGLLQMAIKVTTEPPKGVAAGMARTFNTLITQDFLEKVEPYEKWRAVVFALCFMHSIVYERRKYGPLGFCIPYEFNSADLEASLIFIENHMTNAQNHNLVISWRAIRYMVCDVQYGGRITDDLDREMFWTYGDLWLTDRVFAEKDYIFNSASEFPYMIPDFPEIQKYHEYIKTFPEKDSPTIFGMNVSADTTFRLFESQTMINTLIDTMPKEAGGGSGRTKEDEVKDKLETDLIKQLPENFVEQDYKEKLSAMQIPRGLAADKNVPLNIFLRQEIEQLQTVLDIVRSTMSDMVQAIEGTIIMTAELVDSIDKIFDFRVPTKWQFQAGAEISWLTPTLGGWIKGLIDRHYQLNNWLTKGSRPISFWLTGFYNPQGFLTAAMQEVTRQHSEQKWSLDSVEPKTEVLKEIIGGEDGKIEKTFTVNPEGVCIHGLYIEGAAWSRNERRLEDQTSKDPYQPFPVIHVTAMSTNQANDNNARAAPGARGGKQEMNLEKTHYYCPVYKYPKRNDRYLITRVYLKPDSTKEGDKKVEKDTLDKNMNPKINWKLKGVALLCTKD